MNFILLIIGIMFGMLLFPVLFQCDCRYKSLGVEHLKIDAGREDDD